MVDVAEFMRAPVAAAMFVLADRIGLGPDRLAEPDVATTLATRAVRELNPWTGTAAVQRARALAAVAPLGDLVTATVTDPRNTWWSAPGGAQLLLTGSEQPPPDPMQLPVPSTSDPRWETYAQKPAQTTITSTEVAGAPIRSGAHAELSCGASDWAPGFPVRQLRLTVAPGARVYEIRSAADWHALALRYADLASHPGSDESLRTTAGIDNGPAPDWAAVAADYDGVHLTLTGLLTGLYVPVTADGISTTLWAWEWECTCWLRSAFAAATVMDDLPDHPAEILTI